MKISTFFLFLGILIVSGCGSSSYIPVSNASDEVIYVQQSKAGDVSYYRHRSFIRPGIRPMEIYMVEIPVRTGLRITFTYRGVLGREGINFNTAILVNENDERIVFNIPDHEIQRDFGRDENIVETADINFTDANAREFLKLTDNGGRLSLRLSGQSTMDYPVTEDQVEALRSVIKYYFGEIY